ncbi:MAG: hypothetical protein JO307_06295 [Bryobacterales bacterium]|nr:hypothetical protein [Bryobacterales bacterium]
MSTIPSSLALSVKVFHARWGLNGLFCIKRNFLYLITSRVGPHVSLRYGNKASLTGRGRAALCGSFVESSESNFLQYPLTIVLRIVALVAAAWLPLQVAADDPAGLNIQVVEGEGQAYSIGSRATRGITVQIINDLGKPVEGATVTFRLPGEGPSGAFANGQKTEIATSRGDGRVNAWGMEWNRTPGPLEVRITASKGELRAGTVCSLMLTKAEGARTATISAGHGGHKWLWIALGVGAGAGAGLAAMRSGSGSSPPTAAVSVTQIGTPTIAIGHP